MNRIDLLKKNYQRLCEHCRGTATCAGAQRVWLAVYDKEDERKLRLRLGLFEEATHQTGHRWMAIDLTDAFANWLCGPENAGYAESYFESPDCLDNAVLADIRGVGRGADSVGPHHAPQSRRYRGCPLRGCVPVRVSEDFGNPAQGRRDMRGRLLVFFPGVYEQNNYRLLDARDGWNYHAVPITASEGEVRAS